MRLTSTFMRNLARVVLAADMATYRDMRGVPFSTRLQIANEWLHVYDSYRQRGAVDDSYAIAERVYWDFFRPHIITMLAKRGLFGGQERAAEIVDAYFLDDSPQWHPEIRNSVPRPKPPQPRKR